MLSFLGFYGVVYAIALTTDLSVLFQLSTPRPISFLTVEDKQLIIRVLRFSHSAQ